MNSFGGFPSFNLAAGTSTTDSRGRWIPTICPDQIGNSIAYWLGATTVAERSYMVQRLLTVDHPLNFWPVGPISGI